MPVFEALQERSAAFSEVIALATEVVALGEPGATRRSIGESVSPGFFRALGVGAARGRTLGEGDRGLQHVVRTPDSGPRIPDPGPRPPH